MHGHRRGRRGVGGLVEEEIPHDAGAGCRRLGGLGRAEAAAAGLWRAVVAGGGTGKGIAHRDHQLHTGRAAGRRPRPADRPDCPQLTGWIGNDPCFKVVISLLIVRNLSWILCQTCFLLKPQSQLYAGFDVAGEWSFAFPAHDGIKFAAPARIVLGQGGGAGRADPFRRGRLLPGEPGMPLRDGVGPGARAGRPPISWKPWCDGIAVHNGGGEQFLVSGKVNFDSHHAALLFDALPPLIKVPGASPQPPCCAGRWSSWPRSCVVRVPAARWYRPIWSI